MQMWLSSQNISFVTKVLKPELYELLTKYKPQFKTVSVGMFHYCKTDSLLATFSQSVLSLPTNHPDLNPMEMIWGTLKNWVGQKKVLFNWTMPCDWQKRNSTKLQHRTGPLTVNT
jgi:hypothetical protein